MNFLIRINSARFIDQQRTFALRESVVFAFAAGRLSSLNDRKGERL